MFHLADIVLKYLHAFVPYIALPYIPLTSGPTECDPQISQFTNYGPSFRLPQADGGGFAHRRHAVQRDSAVVGKMVGGLPGKLVGRGTAIWRGCIFNATVDINFLARAGTGGVARHRRGGAPKSGSGCRR